MTDTPTTDEPQDDVPAAPEIERRYGVAVTQSRGQTVLHASPAELLDIVTQLRADGFVMCTDVCGVDYLDHPGRTGLPPTVTPERFEAVYGFLNHDRVERVRVRVQVPADALEVPSLFDHYPSTEAQERETFDLLGIVFTDHPDMTRILMPEDWQGHPLRRDYAVGRIPVQFKGAPSAR